MNMRVNGGGRQNVALQEEFIGLSSRKREFVHPIFLLRDSYFGEWFIGPRETLPQKYNFFTK